MTSTATPPSAPPPTTPTALPTIVPKHSASPIVAGTLTIIAGIASFFIGIAMSIGGWVWTSYFGLHGAGETIGSLSPLWIIVGIVSFVGGIFALRCRVWGLALVGTICALIFPVTLLGILGIVFIVIGKQEFK